MPSAAGLNHRKLLLCLLLVGGTIALYARVANDPFLKYDDDQYVVENAQVRAGLHWSTVKWAFTSFDQANWHPLTWLSHALDCQLFGLNPARQHEVNVLIHAGNVLLLFLFLQGMTGRLGRSLAVAALFAVHPMNVEPVAWIAERKTLLCMLFFLLTLLLYARYARRRSPLSYLSVLVSFAMALMAKPMAITLPFVLLLMDYWPLGRLNLSSERLDAANGTATGVAGRSAGWLTLEKVPLLCLSLASAVITVKAQGAIGAIAVRHPFSIRLQNVIVSYVLYLGKAIWPSHLAVLYPYPNGGWPAWAVVCSAVLLILITAGVLKLRRHRYLLWGWLWFLGTMLPMIGLVQVGNQAMADRYVYLPFVGLFVPAVWGLGEIAESSQWRAENIQATAAVAMIAFSITTYRQLTYWRDDYSLWSHTLAVTRNNFVAEDNLGETLAREGKYYEGVAHFRRAAEIESADPVSEINLGIYLQQQGNLKEAAARYEYGLQLTRNPQLLASAYANLGGVYFTLRDYDRARQDFELALKWNGGFAFVYRDLGLISARSGDWNQATFYFAMDAGADPSGVSFYLLGKALDHAGDRRRADLAYGQAASRSKDINQTRAEAEKALAE